MRINDCGAVEVDESGKELINHGDSLFPLAIYHDHLEVIPVDWHWHNEIELIFQIEGEGLYAINDKKLILHQGEGLFINSEALHGCWDTELHHSDICSLVIHPNLIGGSQESIFWQKYLLPLMQNPTFLFYHFNGSEINKAKEIRKIWEICYEGNEGYEFTVRNRLSDLILLLYNKQTARESALSARQVRNNERIKSMLQFIHTNFSSPIKVSEIAESAMISESEALRCFRDVIHTSPGQYLKHYRIAKACGLLKNTSKTISQIGELCGFSDESYFVKQFREEMKTTPGSYRNQG